MLSRLSLSLTAAAVASLFALTPLAADADWTVNSPSLKANVPQDIVITIKEHPATETETVCLTVTLARILQMDRKANLTLFATLDGVTIGDELTIVGKECETPFDENPVSLQENLEEFLAGNPNNLVICPLCWDSRFNKDGLRPDPDFGVKTSPAGLLLNAEKVIDF